ncbi:MAG: type VI secretion system tube protein Hcp [Caldimonas sp.]
MSNSVAEAYLLILRSSMVPVIGEAVPIPFNEQIELDEWSWNLKHEEETETKKDDKTPKKKDKAKEPSGPTARETAAAGEALIRAVSEIHRSKLPVEKKNEQVIAKIKKANEERTKADKDGEDDNGDDGSKSGDNKLTFTFKKNVDAATTQLLNSMKAGEVMPRAIVSLYHRSSNAPVLLTVKFEKVKLLEYELTVDPTETMSDLKETWKASYEAVDYVYKNRPAASGSNMVTQGTARVFKMKSGSLI